MRRALGSLVVVAALVATDIAAAKAPMGSLRPLARPGEAAVSDDGARVGTTPEGAAVLIGAAIRPKPRGGESDASDVEVTRAPSLTAVVPGPLPATGGMADAGVRPVARDGIFAETTTPGDSVLEVTREVMRVQFAAAFRPSPRPAHPLAGYSVIPAVARSAGEMASHPEPRPAFFKKLLPGRSGKYSREGSVCGVNAIKGSSQKSVGKPGSACGIADPVTVTSVSGVRLSTPATIDCDAAKALNSWVEQGIKPAFGRKGGGVEELKVAASYACRRRNNLPSGKLSEHAKGHAIDIAAFRLRDGTEVSVLQDWGSKKWSATMRKVHAAACGPFGTVLGPKADRYHQDHFHVDVARYRSGTYCR